MVTSSVKTSLMTLRPRRLVSSYFVLLEFSEPNYITVVIIQDLKDWLFHNEKVWFYSHFYPLSQTVLYKGPVKECMKEYILAAEEALGLYFSWFLHSWTILCPSPILRDVCH